MKISLTPEVLNNLLKFKIGTMVVSQSGEYIGYVSGYHMHERNYNEWDTLGRWIYQLKIKWASTDHVEEVTDVDFNDVIILE